MKQALLLIYPALLLVCTFYGAKFSGRGRIAPDFLCLKQTRMIQAAACIGIIIHHVTQRITGYVTDPRNPISIFNELGFLFTSLFFFFSGYGLMVSLQTRPDYLKGFLQKRLPAVLIPFWAINLCLVLSERFIYGVRQSGPEALGQIFGITLINSNGWFVIEIVILYLLFYVLFSLIRKKEIALILLSICAMLLIRYAFFRGHDPEGGKVHWFRGEWWYNSTIAFPLGLWYAFFRRKVNAFMNRHYAVMLAFFGAAFPAAVYASAYAVACYGYYNETFFGGQRDAAITLAVQTAACLIFVTLVVLLNMRMTIGNRALAYVSSLRLPLFLIHGYFVSRVFAHTRMSHFARYAVVFLCGMACAAVITPVLNLLIRKTTAFLKGLTDFLPGNRMAGGTLEAQIAAERRVRRNRHLKIGAVICLALCLAGVIFMTVGRSMIDKNLYRKECEALRSAGTGDIVYWGRFDTDPVRPGRERLTWLVIGQEGDTLRLLCEKGIAGSSYNQKHEAVAWEESDLYGLLGSDAFTGIFSAPEAACALPAGGEETNLLTLLTPEEAMEVFRADHDRELAITPAAELQGTNINRLSKANEWDMKGYRSSWWWLRGESGRKDVNAPIVTVDGEVSKEGNEVNRPEGAIRPVIRLRVPKEPKA